MTEHSPRGGSFIRDPNTGKLTLVEETLPEAPADEPAPAEPEAKAKKIADKTEGAN